MKFSSKNLADFYCQLGTLVKAGLPIQSALNSALKTAPGPLRATVAKLATVVNAGTPLHEAVEQCGRQFAILDRRCLAITEQSGALDVGLLSLGQYYERLAEARRRIITGSMYPVFLISAAVFLAPFPELFLGKISLGVYLWQTAGLLARLVIVGWIGWKLARWAFTVPGLDVTLERAVRAVPVFGRLRFDYALSQWVALIRLMLTAGIGVVPALEQASRAVSSPLIAAAYKKARPLLGGHLEVSQALAETGEFPDDLIQLWATGEQSGRLDEMLDRLAKFYEERWRNSLDLMITWLPRVAYFLAVLFVAAQILNQFSAYVGTYNSLLE
ncbi:MAG: type II secretion system F family protein [Verrucomicrobiota bacterium]